MLSAAEEDTLNKIKKINAVVEKYVDGDDEKILASELMPEFIIAGVFDRDYDNGYPIRSFLNNLHEDNRLHEIPYAKATKKGAQCYFVFNEFTPYDRNKPDEQYVIDLCDRYLKQKALRQHKFDFLLSDETRSGKKIKLPVDAYYPNLNLVIEFLEDYHLSRERGRRQIYDERRMEILPKYGIKLVEIDFYLFKYNSKFRIIRQEEKDFEVVKTLLLS